MNEDFVSGSWGACEVSPPQGCAAQYHAISATQVLNQCCSVDTHGFILDLHHYLLIEVDRKKISEK